MEDDSGKNSNKKINPCEDCSCKKRRIILKKIIKENIMAKGRKMKAGRKTKSKISKESCIAAWEEDTTESKGEKKNQVPGVEEPDGNNRV